MPSDPERIAALERRVAELTLAIAEMSMLIAQMAGVLAVLVEAARGDVLPGESPLDVPMVLN